MVKALLIMAQLQCYPFPERNPNFQDKEIFYIKSVDDAVYTNLYFSKITSADANSIAYQFFSIENIFNNSFQYVLPINNNSETCSVNFATIIRESCNLFEIISRKLYSEFYIVRPDEKINIFNFLSLDVFLNLSREELTAPALESYLPSNGKIQPYITLTSWNREELLRSEHIPKWWTAYNKIKHHIEAIQEFATLDNALYSLSALFLLIRKIYGDGLISGYLRKTADNNTHTDLYPVKVSHLFLGEPMQVSNVYLSDLIR